MASLNHIRDPSGIPSDSFQPEYALGGEPATADELKALLVPSPDDALKLWPVNWQRIGNVRNKAPEVAQPEPVE